MDPLFCVYRLPAFRQALKEAAMQRDQRLRHRRDFATVAKKGRPYHDAVLSIRVSRNGQAVSRFGFGVSKRVGNAVVRNRIKRRLRAGVHALAPVGGWDVVITARAPAAGVDYHDLVRVLSTLFARARLLRVHRIQPGPPADAP